MKLLSTIFILAFGLSVFGQTKKPLPKTKPSVVKPMPAPTPEIPKTSTVQIEAAVIFRNGDVVPVARNTFYFLSNDLAKTLNTPEMKQLAVNDVKNNPHPSLSGILNEQLKKEDLASLLYRMRLGKSFATYNQAVTEAILKTVKFQAVSDFQGKAEFKDVPQGKYFLFSQYEIRKAFVVWHIPVESKGETTKIILDSNNRLQ